MVWVRKYIDSEGVTISRGFITKIDKLQGLKFTGYPVNVWIVEGEETIIDNWVARTGCVESNRGTLQSRLTASEFFAPGKGEPGQPFTITLP